MKESEMLNVKVPVMARLIVLTVLHGVAAAIVLEPQLAWDACQLSENQISYWEYSPPNCSLKYQEIVIDRTGCKCISCEAEVPNTDLKINYFECKFHDEYFKRTDCACNRFPKWPHSVQVLDMSSCILQYYYEDLTLKTFDDVSGLSTIHSLILAGHGVGYIAKEVLENLRNVECINADFNKKQHMDSVQTLLSLPKLKRLSMRKSGLTALDVSRFSKLKKTSNVESLWLSDNEIQDQINADAFRSFPGLKGLDLSRNWLKEFNLVRFPTLETLDLSNNLLELFPIFCHDPFFWDEENITLYCPRLARLDLSSNRIYKITSVEAGICLPKLTFLDLSKNRIVIINSSWFIDPFPDLQYVDLRKQDVNHMSLHRGVNTSILLLVLHMENHDLLSFENTDYFKDFLCLQKLFLDGSNMQRLNEEAFLDIFGSLGNLQTLSLANTKLHFVSEGVFAPFSNLTVLNLRDNAITSVPNGCFDDLTQLRHLDLSGNKITVIREQTFSIVLRQRLETLALGQNPLSCGCELLWFRDWLVSQPDLFKAELSVNDPRYSYKCENIPGKRQLSELIIIGQSCLLSREMSSMIIFSCALIIVTITVTTLLYRYRWHLRLILYEAFRGRDDVRRRRLEQGRFAYDVFVSYASEDLPWLHQHIIPELEDRLGIRLCIHDRHFIPGKTIVDNIVDCVENSKKIMMVFTKDFVRSQWCQFELNFCLGHVLENEDAMIIVCVGDVLSREMTSAMMAVLKTTTYILWAEEHDAVQSFWGRLELALQEVLPHHEQAV